MKRKAKEFQKQRQDAVKYGGSGRGGSGGYSGISSTSSAGSRQDPQITDSTSAMDKPKSTYVPPMYVVFVRFVLL